MVFGNIVMLNIQKPVKFGTITTMRLEAMRVPRTIEFCNLIIYLIIIMWLYLGLYCLIVFLR